MINPITPHYAQLQQLKPSKPFNIPIIESPIVKAGGYIIVTQ